MQVRLNDQHSVLRYVSLQIEITVDCVRRGALSFASIEKGATRDAQTPASRAPSHARGIASIKAHAIFHVGRHAIGCRVTVAATSCSRVAVDVHLSVERNAPRNDSATSAVFRASKTWSKPTCVHVL